MDKEGLKCDFDENGNPILYETDSAGIRRKVCTKLKDGTIVFESSYDKFDEPQKEIYRKMINGCPTQK